MCQTPRATFGRRCKQLAPKHGGEESESCAPFSYSFHTYKKYYPIKKKEDITKGEGKESEMLAGKSSSCMSNGAKQELASKRLKAGSLI